MGPPQYGMLAAILLGFRGIFEIWGLFSVLWVFWALLWSIVPGAWGQGMGRPDLPGLFEKREVMIPMRDGVKLHTEIYTPKDAKEALPIFMERTPYGISAKDKGYSPSLYGFQHMFADGYVMVFQDIRGRFGSEGQFVMNRPVHDASDAKGVDESTDTYDTIEWLVKNVPNNNGRVGIAGISYGGFLAAMALVNPHPALKAVSEQACMGDTWLGDDFFHNGAFRLSYGYEYATSMETNKERGELNFDRDDLYEWYLRVGPLSNINKEYLHGKIPSWNSFVEHPAYDDFWIRKAHCQRAAPGDGAESERCRLVGPGGFLRPDGYLCQPGEERRGTHGFSGGGTMESWWLGARSGKFSGVDPVSQQHGRIFSHAGGGAVVCVLAA